MKKPFRPRTLTVGLIALAALAGGAYYYYSQIYLPAQSPAAPILQTARVRTGDIVVTAPGVGNLVPAAELDLGFRSGGTVVEIAVRVGDRVEAGQVLARLDDAAARIQVAQAELNLAAAEQNLAKLTSSTALADAELAVLNKQAALDDARDALDALLNPDVAYYQDSLAAAQRDYDIATANALLVNVSSQAQAVITAQANVDQALSRLQDIVAKFGEGSEQYITANAAYRRAQDDLAAAGLALEVAKANQQKAVDNAQATLETAQDDFDYVTDYTPPSADEALAQAQVKAAEADLAEAQALLAELKGEPLLEGTTSALASARQQVEQARLSLESAGQTLANTALVAPIAGTITAVRADVGEAAGTTPIITVVALDQPLVRFYAEETDLGKVAAGYPINVVFDAAPDLTFTGRIVRVDPALVTVDGVPAVQAWAALDPPSAPIPLVSGLSADVEIVAGESRDTLLVPVQALRELAPGSYAVFVVQPDGQLKLTPVTVGLRDLGNAEILSGLKAGDVVSTGTVETK